ncbi:hypothetical protein OEZ85_002178 [Tetradesmus obliquus]|uniref:Uncharacterized protein n=1 Tax=Tetradesmus obliquus TaxID=3088 RepID=A0ABY8U2V3_TETOB|nr:hypothetical protein OEZ85_002178 [Tetradesmus obliquus]
MTSDEVEEEAAKHSGPKAPLLRLPAVPSGSQTSKAICASPWGEGMNAHGLCTGGPWEPRVHSSRRISSTKQISLGR